MTRPLRGEAAGPNRNGHPKAAASPIKDQPYSTDRPAPSRLVAGGAGRARQAWARRFTALQHRPSRYARGDGNLQVPGIAIRVGSAATAPSDRMACLGGRLPSSIAGSTCRYAPSVRVDIWAISVNTSLDRATVSRVTLGG